MSSAAGELVDITTYRDERKRYINLRTGAVTYGAYMIEPQGSAGIVNISLSFDTWPEDQAAPELERPPAKPIRFDQ